MTTFTAEIQQVNRRKAERITQDSEAAHHWRPRRPRQVNGNPHPDSRLRPGPSRLRQTFCAEIRVSAAQARPAQLPSQALPAAEALMAGDSSALLNVIGWSGLLLAAALATVWVRYRAGFWQAWVIGLPALVMLALNASDDIAAMLPNLL
jgi:hypothetical protein